MAAVSCHHAFAQPSRVVSAAIIALSLSLSSFIAPHYLVAQRI